MPPVIWTARQMKQCQNCFKPGSKEVSLKCCAKCKRAHYCCKECQKADWEFHKERCNTHTESLAQMKSDPIVLSTALQGLMKAETEAIAHRWVKQYRSLLFVSAINALELHTHPERALTHVLFIELSPTFTAEKIPKAARDLRLAFKLVSINICPLDDLFEIFSPAEQAQLTSLKTEIVARTNTLRSQDTNALGFALAAVTLPECDCRRLVPMGTDMSPADVKALRDPTWRRSLETRIARGQPL